MMQLRIKANGADFYLTEAVFETYGSADEADLSYAYISVDADEDGIRDSDEDMRDLIDMTSDDQTLTFDLDDLELDDGETVYLVVTYQMNDELDAGTTFSLQLESISAERIDNSLDFTFSIGTSNAFTNTKTILGSYSTDSGHCSNGIWDTVYGENGVDCGGGCPTCPTVPVDQCSFGCSISTPLCDPFTQLVYSCLDGQLSQTYIPYDIYCNAEMCMEGDFICDYQYTDVSICQQGYWTSQNDRDAYTMYCDPTGCNPEMYSGAQCFDGMTYICN